MQTQEIRFSAVGDIALGDHPLCVGFGTYSKVRSKDPLYPFARVVDELKKADLLFGNLECALSERGVRRSRLASIQMRGHPRNIEGLAKAGFRVLNLANNHSMQHGKEPFLETLEQLGTHKIRYCGVNLENHLIGLPTILEIGGITVAFLGYSLRPRQYFDYNPLYTEGHAAGIEADVCKVRALVDCVIVSLHWGEEFIEKPSFAEMRLARRAIDAGANLIIGHHPHVLRGIESYRGGLIAYSLGNFICDMAWDERLRESLIFNCTITKSGVSDLELIPIWINDKYQPEVLQGFQAKKLVSRIHDLSAELQCTDLSDVDESFDEYQVAAMEIGKVYRAKSHRHFLSHFHRYPVQILIQQLGIYLRNRASGLTAPAGTC